jgi:hypothetical protein
MRPLIQQRLIRHRAAAFSRGKETEHDSEVQTRKQFTTMMIDDDDDDGIRRTDSRTGHGKSGVGTASSTIQNGIDVDDYLFLSLFSRFSGHSSVFSLTGSEYTRRKKKQTSIGGGTWAYIQRGICIGQVARHGVNSVGRYPCIISGFSVFPVSAFLSFFSYAF